MALSLAMTLIFLIYWIQIQTYYCLQLSHRTSSPCPAPVPCLCNNDVIDCRRKNLTSVVNFEWLSNQDSFHVLDYSHNSLNSIDLKAFFILEISSLLLKDNNISFIHEGGFVGLEKCLRILDLSHNHLKTLPLAVGRLVNIVSLDIHDNPIDGSLGAPNANKELFDGFVDSVMFSLGNNITNFTFGHKEALKFWPMSLQHFQQLQHLSVIGVNIDILHSGSFHGFEKTLKSLRIMYGKFRKLPAEIEHLFYLETLQIGLNRYEVGNEILNDHTFAGLNTSLKALMLTFDNFTDIPENLKYLSSLKSLIFEGNKLVLITEESIDAFSNTQVSYISFKKCKLKRIPSSISRLDTLTGLDFSFNQLVTIENGDLRNLPNLQKLWLNDNPLQYIADTELSGLYSLEYLNLTNTRLTIIPEAIHNLVSLKILDIENVAVDCTCDMVWIKQWMIWFGVSLEVYGECETIDRKLQDFIDNRLLSCPDFIEEGLG